MAIHEQTVQRFRRRLACLLVLKRSLTLWTIWAFLWGVAVLILRAEAGIEPVPLLWGLVGIPAGVGLALWLERHRLPAETTVRALLDQHNQCGGLLMAGEETDLGSWNQRVTVLGVPRVRWHGDRSWLLFAASATFVLLGFLMPQSLVSSDAAMPLEVGREVEKLAKQINVLREEKLLEQARAESLKEKLDRLREEAQGKDPVKTFEALDHLQDVTRKAAQSAAESSQRKTEHLARAETLAGALKKIGGDLDSKRMAEAMKELGDLVTTAAAETELLRQALDPDLLEACQAGSPLAPEQLAKLAEALRDGKEGLGKHLAKLHKAGLIDLETLQKCANCGECKGDALAALLKSGKGKKGVGELLVQCMGNKPGQGGTNEGPGASSLTWGPESSEEGVKFKEETLPLNALSKLQLTGLGKGAPKKETARGPSQSGALTGAAAGGGSANSQVILPQHRKAVERFFERPAAGAYK